MFFSCKQARHWAKGCPSNPKNSQKNNNHVKQIWKEKLNKNEEGRSEGGTRFPSNSKGITRHERKDSPSKESPQKEIRKDEENVFEVKTSNGFEALQIQEEENVIIEEILEDGEIGDTNESQYEIPKETEQDCNKVCSKDSEDPYVIFEEKNQFRLPQVNLNSLFQNFGTDLPTSSQRKGEPWNSKKSTYKNEEDEELIEVEKKTRKQGVLMGLKLEPDLRRILEFPNLHRGTKL